MPDSTGAHLNRLSLSYRLQDGRLVPEQLPAAIVPAEREGALFRRLANLADASDEAIVAAASRYGPLGPTQPVNVDDRASFLWAIDQYAILTLATVPRLRRWVASGGRTPIPGNLAPVAHLLAAYAEIDPRLSGRLLVALGDDAPRLTARERSEIGAGLDGHHQALLAAWSRRARLVNAGLAKGEHAVKVLPKPGTARYLGLAAELVPLLIIRTGEIGTTAALMPPDSIGRMATALRPYLDEGDHNLYAVESVAAWREAAEELANVVQALRTYNRDDPLRRRTVEAALTRRLQQVDAFPFPADDILGTFGRALWSLWPRVTDHPVRRRCAWPECPLLLPAGAHGSRRLCDDHRRKSDQERAARNRKRLARSPEAGLGIPGAG